MQENTQEEPIKTGYLIVSAEIDGKSKRAALP